LVDVAVTSSTFCRTPDLRAFAIRILHGNTVRFADGDLPGSSLAEFLANADAAIVGREVITADLLARCPKLKVISKYGVGLDNLDLSACDAAGVAVLSAPGVNARAVAEHALGFAISLFRNLTANDRLLQAGVWRKDGGRQLFGSNVGLIGFGATAVEFARLLRPFEVDLQVVDIRDRASAAASFGGRQADLDTVLTSVDLLSLHVPLTEATRNLLNRERFARMKPGSFLINTSRGEVVDPAALREVLQSGHLAGAALDVFLSEPINDSLLTSLPSFVGTPHTAGNAREAVAAMGQAAVGNLRTFLDASASAT